MQGSNMSHISLEEYPPSSLILLNALSNFLENCPTALNSSSVSPG